ncbi:hypothetical protein [Nocardia yamanashiensis]|uniref:hypothetical protein n=1 Tax=Nocardia yamanashiensis TaxID=209247 RepID=UPI000AFB2589|nr:hypothetical protein [Nocardia yamanashiensis]
MTENDQAPATTAPKSADTSINNDAVFDNIFTNSPGGKNLNRPKVDQPLDADAATDGT